VRPVTDHRVGASTRGTLTGSLPPILSEAGGYVPQTVARGAAHLREYPSSSQVATAAAVGVSTETVGCALRTLPAEASGERNALSLPDPRTRTTVQPALPGCQVRDMGQCRHQLHQDSRTAGAGLPPRTGQHVQPATSPRRRSR
jgi:hypothetical protein